MIDDITNEKIVENSTDFLNELADNADENNGKQRGTIETKGVKGNFFLILFSFVSAIFAYLVLVFNVINIKKMYGITACIISLFIGVYFFTEKNKDESKKFDSITQILGVILCVLGAIGVFFAY